MDLVHINYGVHVRSSRRAHQYTTYNIRCTQHGRCRIPVWRGTLYITSVCLGIQSLWNDKIAGLMENAVKSKAGVYLPGTRVESEFGVIGKILMSQKS